MWIYNKKDSVPKTYLDMDKFPKIEGYDFDEDFDFGKFMESYIGMGIQGSNLGIACGLARNIYQKRKDVKIYLSFTGNMISSGNREIIKFIVKNKHVDCITTTAAGVEEDVIKCIKPFHLGTFDVKGQILLNESIGRIGNMFVPADRYLYLERFLNNIFPIIAKSEKILCSQDVTKLIGEQLEKDELTKDKCEESFLYWAFKNDIPVFCPGLTDGAFGDMSVFYRQKDKKLIIDITQDNERLTNLLLNSERAASIILGGGIAKHFLLNAAIFRDGFDYSIYISTAQEYDGSDSGGNQEEAISWAKIKPEAERVKVYCDATIAFPLFVASVFAKQKK